MLCNLSCIALTIKAPRQKICYDILPFSIDLCSQILELRYSSFCP